MLLSSTVSLSYGGLFFKNGKKQKKKEKEERVEVINQNQVDTKESIKGAPKWYNETPKKKGYEYFAATYISTRMQAAVSKAEVLAGNLLAGELKSQRSGYRKLMEREINDIDFYNEYNLTVDQVMDAETFNYRTTKKEVKDQETHEGRQVYRAYVLIEYDVGAMEERMLDEIERNEKLYKRLEATEAYEEMERKVQEYRERQKAAN